MALTSIISVLLGRWKLVTSTSTTLKSKPGVMKMSVSRLPTCTISSRVACSADDSSARSVVVPTETMRPPAARVARMASAVGCETSNHSLCILCSARLSVRTGWKVPAPTCKVTSAVAMPRAASAASTPSSKCRAAVGVGDVGRQGHVAVLLQQLERVAGKAQVEQAVVRATAAEHLGVEGIGEADDRAGFGRLAGAHVGPHLLRAGQHALDQGLDRAAGRLGAVQPCLDDARVVEHQQVTWLQQLGQLAEGAVGGGQGPAVEQARSAAFGGGVLGDQGLGEFEIEVGEGEGGGRGGQREGGRHAFEGRTGPVPKCQEQRKA